MTGDVCKGCGCTNNRACPEGCYWVRQSWCSACHIKSIKPVADTAVRWMRKIANRGPQLRYLNNLAGRPCKVEANLAEGPRLQVHDHIGAAVFTLEPGRAYLAPQYDAGELVTLFENLIREAA